MGPEGWCAKEGRPTSSPCSESTIRTHPLDNRILGGITRKHVFEIARRLGYAVEERPFTLDELASGGSGATECAANEVFTASTLKDIMPVVRVGAHVVGDGSPGPVTLVLLDALRCEQAALVGLPAPPSLASPGLR